MNRTLLVGMLVLAACGGGTGAALGPGGAGGEGGDLGAGGAGGEECKAPKGGWTCEFFGFGQKVLTFDDGTILCAMPCTRAEWCADEPVVASCSVFSSEDQTCQAWEAATAPGKTVTAHGFGCEASLWRVETCHGKVSHPEVGTLGLKPWSC
jgi:hypothetical protein